MKVSIRHQMTAGKKKRKGCEHPTVVSLQLLSETLLVEGQVALQQVYLALKLPLQSGGGIPPQSPNTDSREHKEQNRQPRTGSSNTVNTKREYVRANPVSNKQPLLLIQMATLLQGQLLPMSSLHVDHFCSESLNLLLQLLHRHALQR